MRSNRAVVCFATLTITCLQCSIDGFVPVGSISRRNLLIGFPSTGRRTLQYVPALSARNGDEGRGQGEKKAIKATNQRPLAPFILLWISLRSLSQLFSPSEIPGVFFAGPDAPPTDYLGTAFDIFFVGFGLQTILQQTGLIGGSKQSLIKDGTVPSLADMECRVTLNVGRERGTWMDKDWAASGARLLLPINVRFTREEIDLGFPGEESLGGRFCNRLEVLDDCVTFIGPQGEVSVRAEDGCWATLPITERQADTGEAKLRFFLDFPEEASRNDVTLPAGRVFFSGVCFGNSEDAPLEPGESLLEGPGKVGILTEGGMTIKRNDWSNLGGALGDTNIMLGRYKMDNVKLRDEGCVVDESKLI